MRINQSCNLLRIFYTIFHFIVKIFSLVVTKLEVVSWRAAGPPTDRNKSKSKKGTPVGVPLVTLFTDIPQTLKPSSAVPPVWVSLRPPGLSPQA